MQSLTLTPAAKLFGFIVVVDSILLGIMLYGVLWLVRHF